MKLEDLMSAIVKANAKLSREDISREEALAAVGKVLDMSKNVDLSEELLHKLSILKLMRNAMLERVGLEGTA
jgi:hypothetical protein